MALFGKKNEKSVKKSSKKPSNSKVHKIEQRVEKTPNESEVNKIAEDAIDNEIINLPVYCCPPDKSREIDLFITDAVIQSKKEIMRPYFMGNYSRKSFDMQIKSSSVEFEPSDLVEDKSKGVINLKRK